jgi:hypothetical protein
MNYDKLHEEYMKKLNNLHTRKEKLFEEGKMQNWELEAEDAKKYGVEELRGNKELAMKIILGKVVSYRDSRRQHSFKNRD